MSAEWGYLARLGMPLLKVLPRWILKKSYPPSKLIGRVDVSACGIGPQIYANSDRPPAISGLVLRMFNRLPFPVTLDWLHLEFAIDSRRLINVDQQVGKMLPHSSTEEVHCHEVPLSDGQVRVLHEIRTDSTVLQITGRARFQSIAGDFEKTIDVRIRGLIVRESR
jgi:hypothetical protein